MFGIVDRETQLVEAADAKPLELKRGQIEFDNISFAYEPNNPVLKGVSLTVPSGRTVALVGPSGSGKSTLVNLTLRFFDPQKGKVVIDGQDIAAVTVASLRDAVGLVTQDPVLFDDTIRANIAYGTKPEVEAEVIAAAKAAAAHDFIMAPAKGLRHPRRRGRLATVRRRAPAHRHRAGDLQGRADPAARRADQLARQRGRGQGADGARSG